LDALTAVILAAGSGSRLGGVAKALLRRGEHSYLATIIATAREVGLVDAVVVVGPPYGDAIAEHARSLELRLVYNPEPARGMASSVAIGFAALGAGTAAWLWPVAQPRFGDRGGHPPLVARALWARLAGCAALDGGARTVIAAADVVRVAVDDPGVVRDIDTPLDLEEPA